MRAYEFINPITPKSEQQNTDELFSLVDRAKNNPEVLTKIDRGLSALLDASKKILAKVRSPEKEKTEIKPVPTQGSNQPPEPSKPETATAESLAETTVEDVPELKQKIVELEDNIKLLSMMQTKDPAIEKLIKNLRSSIDGFESAINNLLAQTKSDIIKDIKAAKKSLKLKVKQLVAKAEGLHPDTDFEKTSFDKVQKGIEAQLMSMVELLQDDDEEDINTINKFLDEAIAGNIIKMTELISTPRGNIYDHINMDLDPNVIKTFNKIKSDMLKFVPPSKGSGNYGPAEVALAMFGNPAKKAGTSGDLVIAGEKFELKGSGYAKYDPETKKSTGQYGARLGAKGINTGPVAFDTLDAELKKIDPTLKDINPSKKSAINPKTKKEVYTHNKNTPGYLRWYSPTKDKDSETIKFKISSRFNFNRDGIRMLNDEILSKKSNKDKTFRLLKAVISKLIPTAAKMTGFDKNIYSMVNEDGTIDFDKFNSIYGALSYSTYQQGQDKIVKIMFVNGHSGNYVIVSSPKELQSALSKGYLSALGGIAWNDDQQKATPQYSVA